MSDIQLSTKERFADLNVKLDRLERKVKTLERSFNDMQERATHLEELADTFANHVEKEKERASLIDIMMGHGWKSEKLLKFVFGFFHLLRKKLHNKFPNLKTVDEMQKKSKKADFKEAVLKVFPEMGLTVNELPTCLCLLDLVSENTKTASDQGMFIRVQLQSEFTPLSNEQDAEQTEAEARDLLRFLSGSSKFDRNTRDSLRKFIAVAQCSRPDGSIKEGTDNYLVREVMDRK